MLKLKKTFPAQYPSTAILEAAMSALHRPHSIDPINELSLKYVRM